MVKRGAYKVGYTLYSIGSDLVQTKIVQGLVRGYYIRDEMIDNDTWAVPV